MTLTAADSHEVREQFIRAKYERLHFIKKRSIPEPIHVIKKPELVVSPDDPAYTRLQVMNEILTTEQDFVKDLEYVVKVCYPCCEFLGKATQNLL